MDRNTEALSKVKTAMAQLHEAEVALQAKPEPSAEAQLREAGFDVVDVAPHNHISKMQPKAVPCADGHIRVTVDCDDTTRAIAALKAARGEMVNVIGCESCPQLTARTTRIEELEAENKRLRGEAVHPNHTITQVKRNCDAWKRQAVKQSARNRTLRTALSDRDKTITGLRMIQDMLARNADGA